MPLIVETGAGVANANSYVSLEEAREFALLRGVTLTEDDDALTALLVKATDYLEMFSLRYVGALVAVDQALSWPRSDVVIYDEVFAEDAIPEALKKAQMLLVMEQANGVNIMPTVTGNFVKRRKVGPIETEYSERVQTDALPSFPHVTALLDSLLALSSGFALTTVRV